VNESPIRSTVIGLPPNFDARCGSVRSSLHCGGKGQFGRALSLTFFLVSPISVRCLTTTQVPHLGQVTHEHAMRSAIPQLYCAIDEGLLRHWPRPEFVGLQNFSPPYAL